MQNLSWFGQESTREEQMMNDNKTSSEKTRSYTMIGP